MPRIVFGLFTCFAIVAAGCSSSKSGSGVPPVVQPTASTAPVVGTGLKSIVGVWTLPAPKKLPEDKGGGKVSVTLHFTADGKAKVVESRNDKEQVMIEGNYKQEASEVTITAKKNGKDMPVILTIVKLTDTELTINDPEKGEGDIKFVRKK